MKCKVCNKEIPYNENGTCEECHKIIMERLEEKNSDNSIKTNSSTNIEINQNDTIKKKSFLKDKKNVAIVILSFLLCCYMFSSDTTQTEQINQLNSQITELNQQIEDQNTQIANLKSENSNFQQENKKLKDDSSTIEELKNNIQTLQSKNIELENAKNTLTSQNQELNTKVEELQKVSSATNNSSSTKNNSTSSSSSNSSSATSSSTSTSQTVYVTNTGSKYHRSGCSYLKNSSRAIDKDSAISQGYTACSRCNP